MALFVDACGQREAKRALPYGKMYTVDEAKAVGLVDEVCKAEDLEERTMAVVKKALQGHGMFHIDV